MSKLQKVASRFRMILKLASKPNLYFLIGPPSVGKGSWVSENVSSDSIVINRDDIVEMVAEKENIGTYDDMFTRPPNELKPNNTPNKETLIAASNGDEEAKLEVDDYMNQLNQIADRYNNDPSNQEQIQRFGELVPFELEYLTKVISVYGVPPQYVMPLEYSKVKNADRMADDLLDQKRSDAIKGGKDIVVDMTNINSASRNGARDVMLNALDNPNGDINDYYNQIAVVFAPSEEGYPEDMQAKIKEVAEMRAEEMKQEGRSKTIPPHVYDRMFSSFEPPQESEGFSEVIYAGVPSLNKLASSIDRMIVLSNRFSRLLK